MGPCLGPCLGPRFFSFLHMKMNPPQGSHFFIFFFIAGWKISAPLDYSALFQKQLTRDRFNICLGTYLVRKKLIYFWKKIREYTEFLLKYILFQISHSEIISGKFYFDCFNEQKVLYKKRCHDFFLNQYFFAQ